MSGFFSLIKRNTRIMVPFATKIDFPANHYIQEVCPKKQLYVHFTAGSTVSGAVEWWKTRLKGKGKVSTPIIIANDKDKKYSDGEIVQLYDENLWAYALGTPTTKQGTKGLSGQQLCKMSINIEVVNFGALNRTSNNVFSPVGYSSIKIPPDRVATVRPEYKDFTFFEEVTQKQQESLLKLIVYLCKEYKISIANFTKEDAFYWSTNAVKGVNGLYTHTSVREDKYDYPPLFSLLQVFEAAKKELHPPLPPPDPNKLTLK